jgi:N utilization substance protein A
VAYVPRQELLEVEEFDETLVDELRSRAEDTLITRAIAQEEKLKLAQPQPDLLALEGMDEHTARLLASHGIKTRDDLAEFSVDELLDLKIAGIARDQAKDLIMRARAHWFAADEAGA